MLSLSPPNHGGRLRWGLILALAAHLVLLLTLPDIPEMKLNMIGRDGGINVFINKATVVKKKAFQQTLNKPSTQPLVEQVLIDTASGSATPNPGDEPQVTESSPQVTAQAGESQNQDAKGKKSKISTKPEILIDRAMIARFSRQQAVLYANQETDDLERFRRSFNSSRSYQSRNQSQSYKNRYGDHYAKSSSSVGDVCYKQTREISQDDFSTKTVYFFRCDRQPKKFQVDLKTLPES